MVSYLWLLVCLGTQAIVTMTTTLIFTCKELMSKFSDIFSISLPAAIKLLGQITILIALGLQVYVLSGESRLQIAQAEHLADTAHHAQFLSLARSKNTENIFIAKAIEIHQERLERHERKWQRSAKERTKKITWLAEVSFWSAIVFIVGTFLFALGEYLSHRENFLSK